MKGQRVKGHRPGNGEEHGLFTVFSSSFELEPKKTAYVLEFQGAIRKILF